MTWFSTVRVSFPVLLYTALLRFTELVPSKLKNFSSTIPTRMTSRGFISMGFCNDNELVVRSQIFPIGKIINVLEIVDTVFF